MSLPTSDLFVIQQIPQAGRGVVSSTVIATGSIVLQSESPAAHVVFHQYRKEVCAFCFHYNLGRQLPVRHASTGRVFCCENCQANWLKEQGEVGKEAWEAVHKFVQNRSQDITNAHSLPLEVSRPAPDDIRTAWDGASNAIEHRQRIRIKKSSAQAEANPVESNESIKAVDPDILTFFLAGILTCYLRSAQWQTLTDLTMDPRPYRSPSDLKAHCNSYIHLSTILPAALVPTLTPLLCHAMVSAASHNAFGLRGGSEDGEEYLGYGVYPEASYFNHSCEPNLAKKRTGRVWEFRTFGTIGEGEECCISYLGGDEKDLTVGERRKRLWEVWGFECMCTRCKVEAGDLENG